MLVMCETVLHANKLSHTDLKPENILFVNSDSELIDVIRPGKSKKVSNVLTVRANSHRRLACMVENWHCTLLLYLIYCRIYLYYNTVC